MFLEIAKWLGIYAFVGFTIATLLTRIFKLYVSQESYDELTTVNGFLTTWAMWPIFLGAATLVGLKALLGWWVKIIK